MQDAPKPEDVTSRPILTDQGGEARRAGDPADVEGRRRAVDFADAEAVVSGSLGDEGTDAWTPVGFARRRDREVGIMSAWADPWDVDAGLSDAGI